MIVGKAIPKPYNRDASRIVTGNLPYAQLPTGGGGGKGGEDWDAKEDREFRELMDVLYLVGAI